MMEEDMEDYEEDEIPEELDRLILSLGELLEKYEQGIGILVPAKMANLNAIYEGMQLLMKDMPVEVIYAAHTPYRSVGSVKIEGDLITFNDGHWLGKFLEFADNIEMYPLTTGKVRITFGVNGLVRTIATWEELQR